MRSHKLSDPVGSALVGNRDDLLAGAKRCLLERGYAASTVRDIATEANVSMAAIGYHYGSREVLLTRAMDDLMGDWGQAVAASMSTAVDYRDAWVRIIESFTAHRALFAASIEAAVLAQRSDPIRELLGASLEQGRSGLAAALLAAPEDGLDRADVRSVGSAQLALISGVLLQHLTDPEHAPSADEVVAGLQRIAGLR
jgi:AcrR family transcriptional regulator